MINNYLTEEYNHSLTIESIKSFSEQQIIEYLEKRYKSNIYFSWNNEKDSEYGHKEQVEEIDKLIYSRKSNLLNLQLARYGFSLDIAKKLLKNANEDTKALLFSNELLAKHHSIPEDLYPKNTKLKEMLLEEFSPSIKALFANNNISNKFINSIFEEKHFLSLSQEIQLKLVKEVSSSKGKDIKRDINFCESTNVLKLLEFMPVNRLWGNNLAYLLCKFDIIDIDNAGICGNSLVPAKFKNHKKIIERWIDVLSNDPYPDDGISHNDYSYIIKLIVTRDYYDKIDYFIGGKPSSIYGASDNIKDYDYFKKHNDFIVNLAKYSKHPELSYFTIKRLLISENRSLYVHYLMMNDDVWRRYKKNLYGIVRLENKKELTEAFTKEAERRKDTDFMNIEHISNSFYSKATFFLAIVLVYLNL